MASHLALKLQIDGVINRNQFSRARAVLKAGQTPARAAGRETQTDPS
jgi:hypothetical protein